MKKNISVINQLDFLSGGGEMGERIRNFDWTSTPLGDPETWEQGLKTCVRIILTSAQPMFVWWGPSLINIYNDSYAQIMGKKHPAGLGARAEDVWTEVWDLLVSKIKSVERNEGTYDDSFFFIMERKGYPEEVYVSFSYSPAPGDDGSVKGLFCVCSENTERVINERALQTLRDLGAVAFDGKSPDIIYRNVADVLGKNDRDFPFAIVYKIDNNGNRAIATASTGTDNKQYLLPPVIDIRSPTTVTSHFCEACLNNKLTVTEVQGLPDDMPKGCWKMASTKFVYIPISGVGSNQPYAIIFAALNPCRQFDKNFQQFCELIGERVSVRIPFGKEHLPQQQITTQPIEDTVTSSMFVEEAGALLVKENAAENAGAPGKKDLPLVLVVDDNADMRNHLQSIMLPYFNVITANNGLEALHKIQEQQPALVLSDVMMPVMDGIGLVKELKANITTAHIPIILLTARTGEESKIVGWETGADDYLTKPFSSRELISRVSSQIRAQQIRTEALMDMAEQKQYAKKLEEMNKELIRMNEELTSFAYVSSHDLQEPLRKIQMFSKRILEKEIHVLSEEGKNFFYRMDNAASRMQLLINDLLTYSRTNIAQQRFEKTSLNVLMMDVKQELFEKITATGTLIECEPLPELMIIPFQFKQLFTNLIANSIKFAKPGIPPHIIIKSNLVTGVQINDPAANKKRKYWHLSFADNGTGFDPQYSERIFGLFQRLHGRMEYEGTGIGLAIAKKVVENHNGIITAEGKENEGATIHVFLPE